MVELRFGSIRKWKSRLTTGAMKTQTGALIRIGEVLGVTETTPMTRAVAGVAAHPASVASMTAGAPARASSYAAAGINFT